jgi:type IV pilus assembly protein PilV
VNEETAMHTSKRQSGVMLIEALVAILIFSIGILAVVGMQGTAIRNVTDAKVRSDAGFLVDELMSQIWTDKGNINAYAYPGSGSVPARLTGWMARVNQRLPGSAAVPPTVVITGGTAAGGLVQITVFWRLPEETTLGIPPHQHMLLATVAYN